ncbi:zinc finger protein 692 isoform X4 [Hemicordylus capensis]|uniref:zinc finger protein 692 isoform X4 n=1 Tax=Hemicordylus capensis TaxID=884348 RepID=UPI00230275EA|nr:zinc finger protein 692 isoform X4 [Hemicordylus capensis]
MWILRTSVCFCYGLLKQRDMWGSFEMMDHGRQGRQRTSETIRKQKRKELDARRSKCRIRIGSHLEQWCQLKEQLGFSLHSQLAKYLLDRYSSQGCTLKAAPSDEIPGSTEILGPESTLLPPEGKPEVVPDQAEEEEGEDLAEEDNLAYTDDLRDETYQPSLDRDGKLQRYQNLVKCCKRSAKEDQPPSEICPTDHSPSEEKGGGAGCKKRAQAADEDVAQIGPKRIRKAAKREILLCDYDGCGKIFSNRQYLNHHKKYQHVHQKTFTCSDPTCGKSFNFKKHLKEHEKLHSDKRDYICEFCARSFRTSSNLIIHRRIHTGEKPLQCEICGFTCRQKASLNWHMKKHDADTFYQFSCDLCGKKFEKKDNVTAHKSKSHPETATGPPQPAQDLPALSHPVSMEPLENPTENQPREKGVEESALVMAITIE